MESVEEQIKRVSADTAPRVSPADIDAAIESTHFFNMGEAMAFMGRPTSYEPLDLLTLCVVVTVNGFTVVGKSACASPENYNREVGERVALDDAKRQLWPLLGYALRDKLTTSKE